MKAMISRVFSRSGRPEPPVAGHSTVSSELSIGDIEKYYLSIIVDGIRRMLLPLDSFQVHVRRSTQTTSGRESFAGYVRILRWDAVCTPVLLQNLPVIDGRVRKVVKASVLLEGTHFAGLWFQAGSDCVGAPKSLMGLPCELVQTRSVGAAA
ncbi:MAG: hypothetical protein NDJ19_01580 [Ramlibacter sp.]|nr:hypothetical protein [Ramlibacter sp.]